MSVIKELGTYTQFGKPKNVDEVNDRMNLLVKVHWIYTCVGVFFYAFTKSINAKACEAAKLKNNSLNVCGMMTNIWLNFNIDYFPVKQMFYILQIIGALGYLCIGSGSVNIVLVSTEHLICRIDHFMEQLSGVFKLQSENDQKKKLRWCINYHNYIIKYV